jgi:hypothetical protein
MAFLVELDPTKLLHSSQFTALATLKHLLCSSIAVAQWTVSLCDISYSKVELLYSLCSQEGYV